MGGNNLDFWGRIIASVFWYVLPAVLALVLIPLVVVLILRCTS